ncbi:MAG: shikimate kinase [Anaerolineae bacterium]|nr:shikimate kinase [Anaerolineae bacterium]
MTRGSKVNLVLAGFMGTGKTTVGRMAAARLGMAFVDTDDVIMTRAGCSVAQIFAQYGEAAFRQLEADVCRDLAAQRGYVIATGGGALLDPAVVEAFAAASLIVCLQCTLDEILRRVGDDPSRPLFSPDRERLARLLAERAALYDGLPHQIDTTGLSPEQAVEEVIRLWQW